MRTAIIQDEHMLEKAQASTNLHEKSNLVKEALKLLIERKSAKRLANLGGTETGLEIVPRRQTTA